MHVKKMSSSRDTVPTKKESYWELLIFLFTGSQKTLHCKVTQSNIETHYFKIALKK
jgi:hypothetical protein